MNETATVTTTLEILLIAVILAMGLAGTRLLRGPTQADRVMALDVLIISAVAAVALAAWRAGIPAVLDVAVAVAMVTFIGAAALAWYLEKRGEP